MFSPPTPKLLFKKSHLSDMKTDRSELTGLKDSSLCSPTSLNSLLLSSTSIHRRGYGSPLCVCLHGLCIVTACSYVCFTPPPRPNSCTAPHLCSPSLCAGDVLFQMAEVHRQIQVQLEEMVGIPSSEVSRRTPDPGRPRGARREHVIIKSTQTHIKRPNTSG